jgi:hypothetical protein
METEQEEQVFVLQIEQPKKKKKPAYFGQSRNEMNIFSEFSIHKHCFVDETRTRNQHLGRQFLSREIATDN